MLERHRSGTAPYLGTEQEVLGKMVWAASAAHRAAGRQGHPWGTGNPSPEVFPP